MFELLEDRRLLAATHEPLLEGLDYVSGELLVRFGDGVSDSEIAAFYSADQYAPLRDSDRSIIGGQPDRHRITVNTKLNADLIGAIEADPRVDYVEPNYIYRPTLIPNDTRFDELWGMRNIGQTGGLVDADIDAPQAWDITTGSSDTVVGVIDSGIDYTHPDLYLNTWLNVGEIPSAINVVDANGDSLITFHDLNDALNSSIVSDLNSNGYIDGGDLLSDPNWEDSLDNDGNGFTDDLIGWDFRNNDNDPFDDSGHGTNVAGTLGAVGGNATGVTGVSWSVRMMPLKFMGSAGGSTVHAANALYYAINNGADLTNSSWGTGGGKSQIMEDAIAASAAANMLFIAGAGNSGLDVDAQPFYPASFENDNIIAVAAVDASDQFASFSNFGRTTVDLAAPGVSILSTSVAGSYSRRSGTSMAAPHVSGTAALLLSLSDDLSYQSIRDAILDNTVSIADAAGNTVTGGRLNSLGALRGVSMLGTAISPADESVVYSRPTEFVVGYLQPYEPSTVEAGDLLINGIPADDVSFTDASTLTFSFDVTPVAVNGLQTGQIPAGAISATASAPIDDPLSKNFAFSFFYDVTPLAVTSTTPAQQSALTLPFDQLDSASHAAVSQTGMKGLQGAWAVLYGDEPVTPESLTLTVDEDAFFDSERAHPTEQAAYLVFDDKPVADAAGGPFLRTGIATGVTNQNWTTVALGRSFDSMVVVATPSYDRDSPPLVPRIRNATGNSFEIRIQRADNVTATIDPIDVYYTVVEEGVYTHAQHGVKMEAVKYDSTITDRFERDGPYFSGESRAYNNTYSSPVVVGQVMTFNDPRFSTFWSSGDEPDQPPSQSVLQVGKHMGADTDFGSDGTDPASWRLDETIGYIVIEGGPGAIDGRGYIAGVGESSIAGVHGNPPYSYPIASRTVQFDFSEPYDPATLSRSDLVVSEGHVTSANVVDSNTASFTIAGVQSDGALTLELPAGALADFDGAPMIQFIGDYTVDRSDTFPLAIEPTKAGLDGSLVYSRVETALVNFPGDTDRYTIDVEQNQSLTVIVSPDGGLHPSIVVSDSNAVNVANNSATAAGQTLAIQTIQTGDTAGTYEILVGGLGSSSGAYSLEVIVNAAIEDESRGGSDNGSIANAQDITASFIDLTSTARRAAAIGSSSSSQDEDYYRLSLDGQKKTTIALEAPSTSLLQLYNSNGQLLVTGTPGDVFGVMIAGYLVPEDGDYFIRVRSNDPYLLVASINAVLDIESNSFFADAQVIGSQDDILGGLDSLYTVIGPQTYSNARAAAESIGGHLATITDPFEQQLIDERFPPRSYWIGLSDSADETQFQWVTGEPVEFTNWRLRQPDNRDDIQHYAVTIDGVWDDRADIAISSAIVEFADKDYYQIDLSQDEQLELLSTTPSIGLPSNQLDLKLRLYDSSQVLVAEDDNSAPDGRNAQLTYQVPAGGTGIYFIEVVASGSPNTHQRGEYILDVNVVPETVSPTVAITVDDDMLGVGETTNVTFTFSEPPAGFADEDVTVDNATFTPIAMTADPAVFTTTLTPNSGIEDVTNVIRVSTGYTDLAGNTGNAGVSTNYEIDTSSPSVSIALSESTFAIGTTAIVTFTFTEPPIGFDANDLSADNGSLGEILSTADPRIMRAIFVPTQNIEDATNTISVSSQYADTAGNNGSASISANYEIDTLAPTVALSFGNSSLIPGGSTNISFTFSEPPIGFADEDVSTSLGALSDIAPTGSPVVFTATLSTTITDSGNGSVTIGPDYIDEAGNVGVEASAVFSVPLDFGDAPSAADTGFANDYPVTLADDGARHSVVPDGLLRLGSIVDIEPDGLQSQNASGDGVDEDGVVFLATLLSSSTTTETSLAVTSSAAGKLDGWIDFDRDGRWTSPEQVADAIDVTAGTNVITITIPANASAGLTGARFRLSTAGGLAPIGLAADGEVEDYIAEIHAASGDNTILVHSAQPGRVTIQEVGSVLVVGDDVHTLFRGQASDVSAISIKGSSGDDVVFFESPTSTFAGGVQIEGGDGIDTIRLSGPNQQLHVTALPDGAIVGIEIVDLREAESASLVLSESQVQSLPDSGQRLRVTMDPQDSLELPLDPSDPIDKYVATSTFVENGQFVVILESMDSAIEISGLGWSHPINRFDVNNSGEVSALDALIVINALTDSAAITTPGTNAFVDPATISGFSLSGFFDVTRDGNLSALDALGVINVLGRGGEGESSVAGVSNHVAVRPAFAATNAPSVRSLDATKSFASEPLISDIRLAPHKIHAFSGNDTRVTSGEVSHIDQSVVASDTYELAVDAFMLELQLVIRKI